MTLTGPRLLREEGAQASADEAVLTIDGLRLARSGVELLLVERLEVRPAEVVAIIGRSGCGKTTLLSCLSGHLPATGGTFSLGGAVNGSGLRPTFVSRTLQGAPLLHWLTVRQNLALAARIRDVRDADYGAILARFSAAQLAERYPDTLSGGERCRASLSQALLGEPRLLLLDEPFTGLDTIVKESVAANVFRHARASGAAILFVTHDLNDAVAFSDRVIVLGGRAPATIVGEFAARDPGALEGIQRALKGEQP